MSKIGDNGGPPLRDPGWYATHRDMLNHPIVGIGKPVKPADPTRGSVSRFEAWHWLIANCAYGQRDWFNKGQKQTLQPGQVVAGRAYLANLWNWTEKTVRVFLKQLLDEQMITLATDAIRGQQRANTANIITLCNYLKYQLGDDEAQTTEGPAKGQSGASEGPAKGQIEYKETNKQSLGIPPNPQTEPPQASPTSVWGSPREGEEHIGSGVFVNCETIRHRDFSISLLGIEMQLVGTVPMAEIKPVAIGHALQWALDIESGKPASRVVPSNPASFIRGSIQNQRNNSAVTDVRRAKAAAPKEAKSEKLKRLFQAVADEKGGGL